MAPLIAEYDRYMDEMTEQLHKYQVKNTQIHSQTHKHIKYIDLINGNIINILQI